MSLNRSFIFLMFAIALSIVITGLPDALIVNAAKYAQVGREILKNNDWIHLTIGGEPYDQKPPLLFWIGAVSFKLFGVSLYSFKIPVILISIFGIYSTFKLGQLLYNKNTGLLAAIFWSTCIGYQHFHNDIHTDTLLATVVVFSTYMLALFFIRRKWYYFVLGFVGVGLSMLTKGPVGLAIPAFAIGSELLFKKRYKDIFHLRWLIAVIIIFIVIIPALVGLINQFGIEGIKFYFWTNNMGRITGSYKGGSSDPTFYIHNAIYVLAPWTFLAFTGVIMEIIQLFRKKTNETAELINLGAIILYLTILSVAKQKNPHYMLAVVPFIFILAAKWSLKIYNDVSFIRLKKILTILNKIMASLLILIGLIFPLYIFPENKIAFWILQIIVFAGCCYFVATKANLKKQIIMLGLSGAFLLFTLNINMLPKMLRYQTSITASKDFNIHAPSDATLNMYKPEARFWELFLYSKNPGTYIVTNEELKKFLPKKGAWFYTDINGYNDMKEMSLDLTVVKTYENHRHVTSQSIKFLNPKTRNQHFSQMYLIRLN